MSDLKLVMGPDPIFKKIAEPVRMADGDISTLCEDLCAMLYSENAIGIAAPMVGILKRVIAYDLQENNQRNPLTMINPEIIWTSQETQTFEEGSVCFPAISAKITRPEMIKVKYIDQKGTEKTLEAQGWLSSVIQHEIDYLDGKIYLDYLSPIKRNMLLKRTKKYTRRSGF